MHIQIQIFLIYFTFMPWTPHNQEQLIALWTVKRLRHRGFNNIHRYEIEYTISPINSEAKDIVTRRGRFNYAIPGHVFVIKSHDNSINLPTVSFPEVYNRKIPHKHFKPDILIGVDTAGNKHVLHSYPGFYTHPVHHSNNPVNNNNLKENDLYNKLIDTLATKTSTTTQREVPHQIYMNHYGGTKVPVIVANTTPVSTNPLVMMTHPVFNIVPTKPTISHGTTIKVQENKRPLLTTVHYFMPDGEEQLLTSEVNVKDMNELTTEREDIFEVPSTKPNQNIALPKPTKMYYEQSNKPPAVDQLTKIEMTTGSTKPTKKYYKTKTTKPKTTKYTTPKTTYIKPQMTQKKTTSTTKPKSMTHISTSTTKPKSTTHMSTSTTKPKSTKHISTSTTQPKSTTHISTSTTQPKSTTHISTSTTFFGTTKKVTNTTKVMPATTSTTLKTTSTTPISTYSSVQTPETSPATTKKQTTASKSTVPSIASTLLHTTPLIIQLPMPEPTVSSTTSTSTILSTSPIMSKPPPSVVTTISSATETLSKFPTPTDFTHYDITSPTKITTELAKSSSTTVVSSTLGVTTELPLTNQEIEEPNDFPKPTKPMEVIPPRPSDEPVPSNQMSAPGEEMETTPYSSTLMTTIKVSNESVSARDEIEKTTKSTLMESTMVQVMTELEKPTTTAMDVTTKIMETTEHTPKAEATMTIGEIRQPTEKTSEEKSTTSTIVQSDESTENITNIKGSNKTETTESLPEIETTIETGGIFTSTQATADNKLTTSITANSEKSTQNISTIEITTQEISTTRPTTKKTTKTARKHKATSKKPTTEPNDFLIDAEPVKEPIHTKPAKQEYNLDDIFGATIATTKPTLTTTTEPIESELAQQLFGEKMPRNFKVIYANFYEPSTAPTLMKYDETTMNLQPLTSQSYETSISSQVNRPSDASASSGSADIENILKVPVEENTEDSHREKLPDDKYVNSSTESGTTKRNFSTKKDFDEVAMQLMNHARIIEYGSKTNKTSRAKYKKRRTRKPKSRQLTRKRKKLEANKNS